MIEAILEDRCLRAGTEPQINKPWIGVDLDGTLAHFDRWEGIAHIGEPIWPMVARVKQWIAEGRRVKIFTARIFRDGIVVQDAVKAVEDWCYQHIGQRLEVTNIKDLHMIELWDDRAVQVGPNTGEPTTYWTTRV